MRVSLSSMPDFPKTYSVDFPRLDGGLNLWELDYRIKNNQSPEMKNMWWQDGVLQCRDGQTELLAAGESTGWSCYEAVFWGMAFFHIGGKLLYGDPAATTLTLTELQTGVPENRGTWFRYGDWLFYKNRGGFYRVSYDPDDLSVPFSCSAVGSGADEFVPVTVINANPSTGSGELYQPENRLSEKKTVRYNAKEGVTDYTLPVTPDSIVSVKVSGADAEYTWDSQTRVVKFVTAPAVTDPPTNNTVEITYSKANPEAKSAVMDCCYAMVAGGSGQLCILLAGCPAQPNAVFWNSNDQFSMNPNYWPMSYYNLVGDTEDPVSGFGRQYSDIIVLKHHSVGKLDFGTQTVEGRESISFTYTNVNSKIGCDLPWSIQLIENNLVFCNTYQGVQMLRSSSAAYENNIVAISRNIDGTDLRRALLHDVRQAGVTCSLDDDSRYWLCANGHVYLWDYALSTYTDPSWFYFDSVVAAAFFRDDTHHIYHLAGSGRVTKFERNFCDYNGPIEKVYQFPAQIFGSYERLKDVLYVIFSVRSDTDTEIKVQYDTDYETRLDKTNIESRSWRLVPRNLTRRVLTVPRYALVAKRKPGCRHIRHFALRLSNNKAAEDLAIVSAQVYYRYTGRER